MQVLSNSRNSFVQIFYISVPADFTNYTILQRLRHIPSGALGSVSNSISIIYTPTMPPPPFICNSSGEIMLDRQHFHTDDFLRVSCTHHPNMAYLFLLPRCQIYRNTGGLGPNNQASATFFTLLQSSAINCNPRLFT